MKKNGTSRSRFKALFTGLATVDLSYIVDEIPGRNQKISVPEQQVSTGGPATNAAITFSALGGRSALITGVGKHPLGRVIRQELEAFGVKLHDLAGERKQPPPVSSIMVRRSSGERTVVSANAAALGPIHAKPDPAWFSRASLLQVDAQYMELCIACARYARTRAIPVVLDSGSWKEGMSELLPLIDIAVCSDDFRPPGCRDEADVMEFLVARGVPKVAITRGAAPILYRDHNRRGEIPVEPIQAVDTLGAGDVLHGAFCYYACEAGREFQDCLALASRVATFSCLHRGARSWVQAFSAAQGRRP